MQISELRPLKTESAGRDQGPAVCVFNNHGGGGGGGLGYIDILPVLFREIQGTCFSDGTQTAGS